MGKFQRQASFNTTVRLVQENSLSLVDTKVAQSVKQLPSWSPYIPPLMSITITARLYLPYDENAKWPTTPSQFQLDHRAGIVIDRLHQATHQKPYKPSLVRYTDLGISHNGTSQLSKRVRLKGNLSHSGGNFIKILLALFSRWEIRSVFLYEQKRHRHFIVSLVAWITDVS